MSASATSRKLFIGLMSGTSLDGVDGVLCRIGADGRWHGVLAHAHRPFSEPLRGALMALQSSGPDELHRAALAGKRTLRDAFEDDARLRWFVGDVRDKERLRRACEQASRHGEGFAIDRGRRGRRGGHRRV